MKAEASSDSDLEVLYIKPAPKRPRRSSVPVVPVKLEEDISRCAQLPLAASSRGTGSKDFKVFCQQGHDLKLVPPPANVILNRSEYAYFNVSCDVCGTQIVGDFYRCDVCKLGTTALLVCRLSRLESAGCAAEFWILPAMLSRRQTGGGGICRTDAEKMRQRKEKVQDLLLIYESDRGWAFFELQVVSEGIGMRFWCFPRWVFQSCSLGMCASC